MTTVVVPSGRERSRVPRKTKLAVPPLNCSTDEQTYGVVESSDSIVSGDISLSAMIAYIKQMRIRTSSRKYYILILGICDHLGGIKHVEVVITWLYTT